MSIWRISNLIAVALASAAVPGTCRPISRAARHALRIAFATVAGFQSGAQESGSSRALAALRVPAGFTVELAADAPGAMHGGMDEKGHLFLLESPPRKIRKGESMWPRLRMLSDTNGDGVFETSVVFSDNAGVSMQVLSHQGGVFVVSEPEVVRLGDSDGDGKADQRKAIFSSFLSTGVLSAMVPRGGPFLGTEGWFYVIGSRTGRAETNIHLLLANQAAAVWRMRPDGSKVEYVAGGILSGLHRVAFLASGEMVGAAADSSFVGQRPFNALVHVVEGGLYGPKREPLNELTRDARPLPALSEFESRLLLGLAVYRGSAFGTDYRGNLFTTHLTPRSPGTVRRHTLKREGATIRSEDSDFLTSSDAGFQPMNAIEDADGSLVVVNGGTNAAIYRVRRTDAPKPDDPRGEFLRTVAPRLSHGALVNSFQDPRPAVRDLAAKLLRERVSAERTPAGALPELLRLREKGKDVEARCLAVQHLARFGALGAVAAALDDESVDVRVAAARALGDAKLFGFTPEPSALLRLQQTLRVDPPPVRREAATTLGRLADESAGPALLAAATHAADAFEEHAILHALVQLKDRALMNASLNSTDPGIRRAAQIVLSQMGETGGAWVPGVRR